MARITSCTTWEKVNQLITFFSISCFSQMKYPEIELHIKNLERQYFSRQKIMKLEWRIYQKSVNNCLMNQEIAWHIEINPHLEDNLVPFYRRETLFVQNLQTRTQNICLEENSRYYLPNLPVLDSITDIIS